MVDEHEFFKTCVTDVKNKRSRQRRSLFFSNNPTIRLLLKNSELYKMLIKYMSVVPEWAREVLDVLIFIASECVAWLYLSLFSI